MDQVCPNYCCKLVRKLCQFLACSSVRVWSILRRYCYWKDWIFSKIWLFDLILVLIKERFLYYLSLQMLALNVLNQFQSHLFNLSLSSKYSHILWYILVDQVSRMQSISSFPFLISQGINTYNLQNRLQQNYFFLKLHLSLLRYIIFLIERTVSLRDCLVLFQNEVCILLFRLKFRLAIICFILGADSVFKGSKKWSFERSEWMRSYRAILFFGLLIIYSLF